MMASTLPQQNTLVDLAQDANGSFTDIPIIDLTDASSPDPAARRTVALAIREACMRVGFFYIKNHDVSDKVILDAVDQGKVFFDLPLEQKMEIHIHKSSSFKGYTPLLGENTDPENRGDLHEGFDMGWEDDGSLDGPMGGENVWPASPQGFKPPVLTYYHTLINLGKKLFPLFALALDLPEGFFDDKTRKPAAIMRILHYPPQVGAVDDRVIGIGAHTDYECFTILWQDNVQALQVLNNDGQWIDAPPIPGTFVVNIGDQLARWTNDVFKSTRHRAINRSGVRRYSTPLFFGSDYDVVVEALSSCVSAERPAKYPPVIAGEYVKSRLEETYAHSKDD